MSNSHFRRGSGCFACVSCGRQTRDTGVQSIGCELCPECFEAAGIENEWQDGHLERAEAAEQLRGYYDAAIAKGGSREKILEAAALDPWAEDAPPPAPSSVLPETDQAKIDAAAGDFPISDEAEELLRLERERDEERHVDTAERFAGFDRGDGAQQYADEDAARIEQWEREAAEDHAAYVATLPATGTATLGMTEREAAASDVAADARDQREELLLEAGRAAGYDLFRGTVTGVWNLVPPAHAGWRASTALFMEKADALAELERRLAAAERPAPDPVATLSRHAASHRALASSDAYSAQEAPRLEGAMQSVLELVEAAREVHGFAVCVDGRIVGAPPEALRRLAAALAPFGGVR